MDINVIHPSSVQRQTEYEVAYQLGLFQLASDIRKQK
jgi:hypothetical protein